MTKVLTMCVDTVAIEEVDMVEIGVEVILKGMVECLIRNWTRGICSALVVKELATLETHVSRLLVTLTGIRN